MDHSQGYYVLDRKGYVSNQKMLFKRVTFASCGDVNSKDNDLLYFKMQLSCFKH